MEMKGLLAAEVPKATFGLPFLLRFEPMPPANPAPMERTASDLREFLPLFQMPKGVWHSAVLFGTTGSDVSL